MGNRKEQPRVMQTLAWPGLSNYQEHMLGLSYRQQLFVDIFVENNTGVKATDCAPFS